ncbi:DUF1206 domain-containing protein [Arsenicitalea aurantiaca]|uniref:DUF1206 domain-containing protein n=1 Tax=Arsenicitalea aurantiaca TaxID=1783274 RepID=A0A433XLE6_9HYPH|nr:DUF1206 domain-containing protein [Arsenicitalea aurantiaca]RUT34818.1 DUF1206 domain-containing protein [Arsenicitalea aurantiaca]
MARDSKFETLARSGYAARGVVYLIVGGLALFGAIGGGGADVGPEGALGWLLGQPFGRILLGLVGIGLAGHAAWRLVQGIANADDQDNDAKGIAVRAGMVVSGITHTSLALFALGAATGMGGSGGGEDGGSGLAATVLGLPFGAFLLGLAGIAVIGAGIAQIWKGATGGYRKYLEAASREHAWITPVCALGLGARGAVLLITGGFIVFAAIAADPEQVGSVTEALAWVRQLPFGGILYGLVALGLFAFGLYSLIQARYRQIDAPDPAAMARTAGRKLGV